jgi:hypothetical protein
MLAVLSRLKPRDRNAVLTNLEIRAPEVRAFQEFEQNAAKTAKMLASSKTASPRDAYAFLEKVPLDILAYLLAESSNSKVNGKIRSFLYKWKPLRQGLPVAGAELETLGLEHGQKFDKVLEDFFQAQLSGRARKPEDRVKLLRKLSGIKEAPKKPEKDEKKKAEKPKKKNEAAAPSAAPSGSVSPRAAALAGTEKPSAEAGKTLATKPPASGRKKPEPRTTGRHKARTNKK